MKKVFSALLSFPSLAIIGTLIFSLVLWFFGALLGFSGLLIAVPVAAVIGVMSRFSIGQYKSGRLYQGPAEQEDSGEEGAE